MLRRMRALLFVSAFLPVAASAAPLVPAGEVPTFWRTFAERTGYRRTPGYDETMGFLRRIAAASPSLKVESYGTSGQGRELPLVIVSRERAFTPEAARATGKPVVLIQNGIHAGEIEGKDATLALLRDLLVLQRRPELLDEVILLVLPIFSVDAHERSGPHHRINQNGPEEMGWRTTPIGLNLNRDYLKAEAPEMRAMLSRVYARWRPHLLVDNHTTDGADYRHDVTLSWDHGPTVPGPVRAWMDEAFERRLMPALAGLGHLPAPYLVFARGNDPRSGIRFADGTPRYSNSYPPLHGRAGLLVETHMLKPYRERVHATYDVLLALLEELRARPRELPRAVAASESLIVARGRDWRAPGPEVALSTRLAPDSMQFPYKGVATRWEHSDITGSRVPRYSDAPWDTLVPLFRTTVAERVVRQPAGYLVPQEWTVCRDRLDVHGVRYRRFARVWTDTVEVQRVLEWSAGTLREGHHPIAVERMQLERRARTFRPGDLWVPLDQPAAMVAVHLFEAQAPDGLMHWNAFDTVLEFKEHGEDYVVEPLARRMLAADPALARAFRERLGRDPAFAGDPDARVDFFYRRSPWADPDQNLHPVARALARPPEAVLEP